MGNIALTDVIPQDSLERQLYFIEKCKTYVADLQEKLGRPLTCCTQTFGCQMNARDSEKLLGIFTDGTGIVKHEVGFFCFNRNIADFR